MREKTVIRVIRRYKDRLQVFGNTKYYKSYSHFGANLWLWLIYDFDNFSFCKVLFSH